MKTPEFLVKTLKISMILSLLAGVLSCESAAPPTRSNAQHGKIECNTPDVAPLPSPSYSEINLSPGADVAQARFWPARGTYPSQHGIIFVSGVDGGYIEPADDIYTAIAERYSARGIAAVFVQYRTPGLLEPSVEDALAGVAFLRNQGVTRMAILGWSFGGAVMIHSATRASEIVTALGFAPQAKDTEPVNLFRPEQSLLLFHSDADENVPYESSQIILDDAPPFVHKGLHSIQGANHLLEGEGERLAPIIFQWLEGTLPLANACS